MIYIFLFYCLVLRGERSGQTFHIPTPGGAPEGVVAVLEVVRLEGVSSIIRSLEPSGGGDTLQADAHVAFSASVGPEVVRYEMQILD